ncbi:PucR family transcriptional regulator [Bifidobacterium choloepi]|uniref:PucR family transcriptional regulator n=1 Tax=Bifidobacterium choloepi TaxID=2614131 RepID=A0A6I5MZI6_9BIFI|nr:helix-turn-helix domain-containing protein [Bifidobacterium choloepi]NEG69717.1 PucR family transcriptional regulator [Bifidobacterium choloepi]
MDSDQGDVLDLLGGRTDDATIERLAFECLVHGLADDRIVSLMNILGWLGDFDCFAVGGEPAGGNPAAALAALRRVVADLGGRRVVFGVYGTFVIAAIRANATVTPEATCAALLDAGVFADASPVYLSTMRSNVPGAVQAVRETLFSLQAAPALPSPERPIRGDELLPERALLGDDYAREELYYNVYAVLRGESDDDPTYLTVSTFLNHGGSLEATARDLNVHPNTVRYRLKRAAETIGWDATDPRDAFVLATAIAIGRMRDR